VQFPTSLRPRRETGPVSRLVPPFVLRAIVSLLDLAENIVVLATTTHPPLPRCMFVVVVAAVVVVFGVVVVAVLFVRVVSLLVPENSLESS